MKKDDLVIGLQHNEKMVVADHHTVPNVESDWPGFIDMPSVFATAFMIGFVEQTCVQALRPFLTPGQHTVGTLVNISHSSPTPVGMTIETTVKIVEIKGRKLTFEVACEDERGSIGRGIHERAIINVEDFMKYVQSKRL